MAIDLSSGQTNVFLTKSKQNKNVLVARPEEGSPRNAWMFFLIHSRAAI